jgi:hypothetical protein
VRIAFLDTQQLDYTADTPYPAAARGSQSALCYLAAALAQRGHEVAVLNATTLPGRYRDVQFYQFRAHPMRGPASLRLCRGTEPAPRSAAASRARHSCATGSMAVACRGSACGGTACAAEERDAWSGFAFVSDWQRERFVEQFRIPCDKAWILRNAISPAFAETPLAPAWFERDEPPVLVYTSNAVPRP